MFFYFLVTIKDTLVRTSGKHFQDHWHACMYVNVGLFLPFVVIIIIVSRRAAKCYQRALDLQPMNTEAAMSLGDVLTENGNDVSINFASLNSGSLHHTIIVFALLYYNLFSVIHKPGSKLSIAAFFNCIIYIYIYV